MAYQLVVTKTSRPTRRGQEGVTLLLTLMIMAALSAIVFSISAIALNEVRTSKSESGSEPAITAAQGEAEEQLFTNVRGLNTSCASAGSEVFSSSGANTSFTTSYYYNGAYNFSIPSGGEQDFYLYNPCNQALAPGYTSVTIQEQSTSVGTATVHLCSWTNTDCKDNGDLASQSLSPGGSVSFGRGTISTNTQYVISVIYSVSSSSGVFSISAASRNTLQNGIPSNQVTIITTGSKDGTTRKLQTEVPQ